MRLRGWPLGRLTAILDRALVFPESTGWPCPRDGDHDDLHRYRTTHAPEAAAPEVPPHRDGLIELVTDGADASGRDATEIRVSGPPA